MIRLDDDTLLDDDDDDAYFTGLWVTGIITFHFILSLILPIFLS